MPYKTFLDNSPMQASRSFEDNIPMSSPFVSSYAEKVYDRKKDGYESSNESEALDVTPIVIPKLKMVRKKVSVSSLSSEQRLKREQKKSCGLRRHLF